MAWGKLSRIGRLVTCKANSIFIFEIYAFRRAETISKVSESGYWAQDTNLSKNAIMDQVEESVGKFEMACAEKSEVTHTSMEGNKARRRGDFSLYHDVGGLRNQSVLVERNVDDLNAQLSYVREKFSKANQLRKYFPSNSH